MSILIKPTLERTGFSAHPSMFTVSEISAEEAGLANEAFPILCIILCNENRPDRETALTLFMARFIVKCYTSRCNSWGRPGSGVLPKKKGKKKQQSWNYRCEQKHIHVLEVFSTLLSS